MRAAYVAGGPVPPAWIWLCCGGLRCARRPGGCCRAWVSGAGRWAFPPSLSVVRRCPARASTCGIAVHRRCDGIVSEFRCQSSRTRADKLAARCRHRGLCARGLQQVCRRQRGAWVSGGRSARMAIAYSRVARFPALVLTTTSSWLRRSSGPSPLSRLPAHVLARLLVHHHRPARRIPRASGDGRYRDLVGYAEANLPLLLSSVHLLFRGSTAPGSVGARW